MAREAKGPFFDKRDNNMALIKCSEYGKEISDKAAACPNCGNPIHKQQVQVSKKAVVIEKTGKGWKALILVAGIMFWVGLILFVGHIGAKTAADLDVRNLGNTFFVLGAIGWIIGKIGAWWHHG